MDRDFKDWLCNNLPVSLLANYHATYLEEKQMYIQPVGKSVITNREIRELERYLKDTNSWGR